MKCIHYEQKLCDTTVRKKCVQTRQLCAVFQMWSQINVPVDGVSAGCRVVTVYVVLVPSPAGHSNMHIENSY